MVFTPLYITANRKQTGTDDLGAKKGKLVIFPVIISVESCIEPERILAGDDFRLFFYPAGQIRAKGF
ncbi:MAG: hypothetical protein ACXWWA_10055 [Chitinophagaceae bacterium]